MVISLLYVEVKFPIIHPKGMTMSNSPVLRTSFTCRVFIAAMLLLVCLPHVAFSAEKKGVVVCEPGYSLVLGPVKAGDRTEQPGGKYWNEYTDSRARLEIELVSGKVWGTINRASNGRSFVINEKYQWVPLTYSYSTQYNLNGSFDYWALENLDEIDVHVVIDGDLKHTTKDVLGGKPDSMPERKSKFHGLVCFNTGLTSTKFPELGDSFILLFEDPHQPWKKINAPSKAERRKWLEKQVKENFEFTEAIGIVKANLTAKHPWWFVDAANERYYPDKLLDGSVKEDTYDELIFSLPARIGHVKGAATDGVTRVWTIVQCPGPGKATFSLERDTIDGGFCRPQAVDTVEKSVTVETYQQEGRNEHYAFVLYAPPAVFGASEQSRQVHHRDVDLQIAWEPDKIKAPTQQANDHSESFTLVRPPVILQHGTYDNANYCWRKYPQDDLVAKDYPKDHAAMFDVLKYAGFVLPDGQPAVFTVSYENDIVNVSQQGKYTSSGSSKFERDVQVNGKTVGSSSFVNLAHVLWENPGGIRNALQAYRESGIAATQADVICHSLGGLVARLYIRGAHLDDPSPQKSDEYPDSSKHVDQTVWYYRPENYMKGDVHRLITISTTHKGSDAPGMLIPYQALADNPSLRFSLDRQHPQYVPILRAADIASPGTIGPVDRRTVKLLLHFINYETGTGGAFIDQQPGSPALNAIGITPVPSHAIACISQDADLDTFKGFYWQRMHKIHMLSPDSILARVLRPREHGDDSFAALRVLDREDRNARLVYASAIAMTEDGVFLTNNPMYAEADALAEATHRRVLSLFRSVIFGNNPNDCTVRRESSLGGLTEGVDGTVIDHVLHGYASTYPSVQARVVQLLRGGYQNFNMKGFPTAGGPTKDMPPPSVAPPPPKPKVSLTVKTVSDNATRLDPEQMRIERLEMQKYLASDHIIACNSGTVDLQLGFDGLDDAIVKARLDAKRKATLLLFGDADPKKRRLEAHLLEGTVHIDKDKRISCLLRTYTPSAVIDNRHTSYTVAHDYDTQTTNIIVHDGTVRVYPLDGNEPYDVTAGKTASHKKPDKPVWPSFDDVVRLADVDADDVADDPKDTYATSNDSGTGRGATADGVASDTSTGGETAAADDRPTINRPKGPIDHEITTLADNLPDPIPFHQSPPPATDEDMSGWTVDFGTYDARQNEINASPASDGKTSYYIAPQSLLGKWTGRQTLSFEKKSWGGSYYDPYSYAAYGDVVISSGSKSARFDIKPDHSGNWLHYYIPLRDQGWKFSGGARSLSDILSNVTSLKIRAEYGVGTDYSALRSMTFDGQTAQPSTNKQLPPDVPFKQLPPPTGSEGMSEWTMDFGTYDARPNEISASPAGDGKTSYYIAPQSLLGKWTGRQTLSFEKKSWGGSYSEPDTYGAYGDVVISNGSKSARFDIKPDHSGNWLHYYIPLRDQGWKFFGGARSLSDILSNVTDLKIRAEYGAGTDYSALRSVTFGGQSTQIPTHLIDKETVPGGQLPKRPIKGQQPKAVISSANPESGKVPLKVAFDASGSHDSDGSIKEYKWDFGDGKTETTSDPRVEHTYNEVWTYRVKLIVVDNDDNFSDPAVSKPILAMIRGLIVY
ncbi:MAG: PKD domain-containing protein [Patescibacteria group bacterium]|nr:PKD domain-containing protein [Patescibacteria group bacterium]